MLHGLVTWKWTDRPTRESTCIKHTKVLILSPSSKALIGPKFFIGLFLESLNWAVSIFLYRDPRLNCRVLSLSPFHIRGYTDFVSFRITFKMSFVFSLTSRIAQVQGRIVQSSPPDCINLEVEIERNRCHVIRVRLALIGRSCSFLISCCSAAPTSSCCCWRHEWRRRKEREAQVVNKQDFSLEESGYSVSSSHSVHRRTNGV